MRQWIHDRNDIPKLTYAVVDEIPRMQRIRRLSDASMIFYDCC